MPVVRQAHSKVCLIGVPVASATVDKLLVFSIDKYGNLFAASNEVNTLFAGIDTKTKVGYVVCLKSGFMILL